MGVPALVESADNGSCPSLVAHVLRSDAPRAGCSSLVASARLAGCSRRAGCSTLAGCLRRGARLGRDGAVPSKELWRCACGRTATRCGRQRETRPARLRVGRLGLPSVCI
eukprot:6029572-Prymnesium_polylepis.2